jgi:excisionase family DNA binding protein
MRENPNQPEQVLSVANVARQLGVSPWTVRDWIKDGKLAAYKVGRTVKSPVRIKACDVDALLIPITPSARRPKETCAAQADPNAPPPDVAQGCPTCGQPCGAQ